MQDKLYKEKLSDLLCEYGRGYERNSLGRKARNTDPTDPEGTLQRDDGQSVVAALKDVQRKEDQSKIDLQGGVYAETVEEFPKLFAPYAFLKIVYDAYSKLKGIRSGEKPDSRVQSMIKHYPVLDKFDIHPAFFVLLDDPILETIQIQFLRKVNEVVETNDKAKVGELPDINDFCEKYINETYPDIEIRIKNRS